MVPQWCAKRTSNLVWCWVSGVSIIVKTLMAKSGIRDGKLHHFELFLIKSVNDAGVLKCKVTHQIKASTIGFCRDVTIILEALAMASALFR